MPICAICGKVVEKVTNDHIPPKSLFGTKPSNLPRASFRSDRRPRAAVEEGHVPHGLRPFLGSSRTCASLAA
jgi:hypothetical protein